MTKLQRVRDYPALLEEAYQQMIAPREPDAPTVISTFAGGGGNSVPPLFMRSIARHIRREILDQLSA